MRHSPSTPRLNAYRLMQDGVRDPFDFSQLSGSHNRFTFTV